MNIRRFLNAVERGQIAVQREDWAYHGPIRYACSNGWTVEVLNGGNRWCGIRRLSPGPEACSQERPAPEIQWQRWGIPAAGNRCPDCHRRWSDGRPLQLHEGRMRCWICHRLHLQNRFGPLERVFMPVEGDSDHLSSLAAVRHHGQCFLLVESSEDFEHFFMPYHEGQVVQCRERFFSPGEPGWLAEKVCPCQRPRA